ncbi:hypothetical protein IW262DRAFT_1463444 [Armillaria fumosa]|nr:hypothetical protein IW262DRAFT_1463444 [Armillaria fumosa]
MSSAPAMPFVAMKAVITQLCQNLSTTATEKMGQLHEYMEYLKHYKEELIKDKEFQETIFKARSMVEKKYQANALKQPIHKVLKTITGWVQSECQAVKAAPATMTPTGPRHNANSAPHGKGKAYSVKKLALIIETDSEDDDAEPKLGNC